MDRYDESFIFVFSFWKGYLTNQLLFEYEQSSLYTTLRFSPLEVLSAARIKFNKNGIKILPSHETRAILLPWELHKQTGMTILSIHTATSLKPTGLNPNHLPQRLHHHHHRQQLFHRHPIHRCYPWH